MIHRFLDRFGPRIEELILVLLIALNVLDFFEIIPAELDYVKKIISWVVLGYIMYKIDLTNIFFGSSHRSVDLFLVISYLFLILKNFTAYAMISVNDSLYLTSFYELVALNASIIELAGFYIGGISLLLISFYYATRFPIKAPSVMHVIHEEGVPPRHFGKLALRFFTIFMVLIAFFVIVFNLIMEWLAIAVDAPLLIAGIFFIFFMPEGLKRTLLFTNLVILVKSFIRSLLVCLSIKALCY